jgi:hypothetical protein
MACRALPVGLLLLTLVMDGHGRHQTALYVVLLAFAAAVAGALSAFGELVDLPRGAPEVAALRLETICLALGAAFVLVASAARAQAEAGVPALGVSGAVGALMLLCPVLIASAFRTATPPLRRALARSAAELRRTSRPSRREPRPLRRAA